MDQSIILLCTTFERANNYAVMKIGEENIESPIYKNDDVFIIKSNGADSTRYNGVVKDVRFDEFKKMYTVSIKINEPVSTIIRKNGAAGTYDLHFAVDYNPHKACLRALAYYCNNKIFMNGQHCLRFPQYIEAMITRQDESNNVVATIKQLDTSLQIYQILDSEQRNGLEKALSQHTTVVTGAPGCGKTLLLAGIVEQVYKTLSYGEKILVCAPTNVATDVFFSKCVEIAENNNDMHSLRLYGRHFDDKKILNYDVHTIMEENHLSKDEYHKFLKKRLIVVEEELLRSMGTEKIKMLQSEKLQIINEMVKIENEYLKKLFSKAKIIGTTCLTSSHKIIRLFKYKLVVIDDGSCTMIPVLLEPITKTSEYLVLAYDLKQLGPVLMDDENISHYNDKSVLHKLENSKCCVKLRNNYRLHINIINLIKTHFYFGQDIIPKRPTTNINSLIFISHDIREKSFGHSIFNEGDERCIQKAIYILKQYGLTDQDIGIIPFYKASRSKLQDKFAKIEIKTVDGYVGGEKKAIVLVTSRNNVKGEVGFIADSRRLNVAITRCSDFLIIIGNKEFLREHSIFKTILEKFTS